MINMIEKNGIISMRIHEKKSKRGSKLTKLNDSDYEATVSNVENHEYHVSFNMKHLRKTTCDCPHADGRMIICKYKVQYSSKFCRIKPKCSKKRLMLKKKRPN